ncbi:uncharacterized protein LOC126561057 [Anopheles maculipalpis]|uniref:uncharacterized protein LOC126561057 n=1 Tax=Anopheles maculipalpis TaxID=1496333 RepID=UPI002159086C|nr:uncharacterized protein LOC126561057 [Anopheles maculipalpis]
MDAVDNITLYSENRFSREQIYVKLKDVNNLHRLFPDKLSNLHGYHMRVGVKQNDYPYNMIWDEVTQTCFLTDRSGIVKFLDDQGIVNYAIIPVPSSASDRVNDITLYTENRFSKEQIYVPLGDLNNLHRLFPNKLTDLYGFHIRIGVKGNDYPYMHIYKDPEEFRGLLNIMFRDIGLQILNLSYSIFHQTNDRYDADVYYDIAFQREHFQHEFAFRDMGGMCISCPENYLRNFFPHLLKPFSIGAWLFLGGVFVVCCLLRFFFPTMFRHDLILQTFFGVVGNEYNQTYPARAILLALSCLSFFFARAYCAKILALVSLGKFYSRPETVEDFMQTPYYMLAVHKETLVKFNLDDFHSKILTPEVFERERRKRGVAYHLAYCSLQRCGEALLLSSPLHQIFRHPFFTIREMAVPNPHRLQFAKNSPIVTVMNRYLGLFYERGLWTYYFNDYLRILDQIPQPKNEFKQTVFYFYDLKTLWMFLLGGWAISAVLFLMELLSKKRRMVS